MDTTKLVIMRHGESQWNKENRFTGWYDSDLSNQGVNEAKIAGKLLKKENFIFDFGYTSMLKRAIHTLWNILDELDQVWLPVEKTWKLNERHYGALQGLNKTETIVKYGDKRVMQWRRSFNIAPPSLLKNDVRYPRHDRRYSKLPEDELPLTESLAQTAKRVIPYWNDIILPRIKNGENVIIVAHGNSIRALVMHLNNINEEDISQLNIPTGIPLVYVFSDDFKSNTSYYLSDFKTATN